MALFSKKTALEKVMGMLGDLSEEELEELKKALNEPEDTDTAETTNEDNAEEQPVEEPTTDTAEETETKAENETPAEETTTDEPTTETVEETTVDETPTENVEETKYAEKEVDEATNAKLDALLEEWDTYKQKIDKLYERLDEVDEPAETVGLGKQRTVEQGDNEEDMSAYDYAMKHATY